MAQTKAKKPQPLRVVNAKGDRLEALKALADRLAGEIDACAAVIPHLSKQYREVLADIEELEPKEEPDDEIFGHFERVR